MRRGGAGGGGVAGGRVCGLLGRGGGGGLGGRGGRRLVGGWGVRAVVEVARWDWLMSEPYELTAVTVVAGSAVAAIVGALRVAWPAARGTRALRRLLHSAGQPVPASVAAVTGELGIAERVDVVATGEAFAVTHGLLRPRILLSTGLVEALDTAELTAVLVHERHHLARRDPLRLLAAGLLAGYRWYPPPPRWWAQRLGLRPGEGARPGATPTGPGGGGGGGAPQLGGPRAAPAAGGGHRRGDHV